MASSSSSQWQGIWWGSAWDSQWQPQWTGWSDTPPQAGFDRQDDGQESELDESESEEEPEPKRRRGSSYGWKRDGTQKPEDQWLPALQIWIVLVDADLSLIDSEIRQSLQSRTKSMFQCKMTWRKNRKTDKRAPSIPYRVSIRGEEAAVAMEWFVDEILCTEHQDLVAPEKIRGLPIQQTCRRQDEVETQVLASFN